MNKKALLAIVARLCKLTNTAASKTEAKDKGLSTYIYLDQTFDNYYSLWEIDTDRGTREQPFNVSRHAYKAGEMATFLYALIAGISYGKESVKP